MSNTGSRKILALVIIWLVVLLSFFHFSAWYYPLLNPDMAIGILMSPGYTPPGDFYLWGQTHHGTLVSFLSNLLIITYLFPAALAWSVAFYFILVTGYFSASTLLRTWKSRMILAAVWFLPAWHFQYQVVHEAGVAVSLLCTGIFLLNRSVNAVRMLFRLAFLTFACLIFILTVWVSDHMFISLLLILIVAAWRMRNVFGTVSMKGLVRQQEIRYRSLITALMTVAGIGFIWFAKSRALKVEGIDLHLFNFSGGGIAWTIRNVFEGLLDVLLFRSGNPAESVFAWMMLAGVPVLFRLSHMKRNLPSFLRRHKWLTYFALNAITSILILPFFLQPAVFTPVIFVSFWMALLMIMENTASAKRSVRNTLLGILVTAGGISALLPLWTPYHLPSSRKISAEYRQLGKAGIIASYEDAYTVAAADPKNIHSTPHDSALIRNRQTVVDVFRQPAIYVIRDNWMKVFPDTLRQFGQILLRRDEPFILGDRNICRYDRYVYKVTYRPGQMKFQGIKGADPEAISFESVKIDSTFNRSQHFVFGPYIPLQQGKIRVEYRLKAGENLSTNPAAVLEVSADYGNKILTTKTIRWSDFQKKHHFETFGMEVEIPKNYNGIEFRIMYLGRHDLWFDQVEMTGM